jgi:hypothetical protein
MKYVLLVSGLAASFLVSGCMTGYTTLHRERGEVAERDSLMPPPMTVNDVIALSQDSVSDDVIMSQMKATDSYFRLSTDDIVALRKAGVSDNVINAMIKTSNNPPRKKVVRYYGYYPYWGSYWYPSSWYWGYPWYPRSYFGWSTYGRFYGGHHFGGFHSGVVRTVRTHR